VGQKILLKRASYLQTNEQKLSLKKAMIHVFLKQSDIVATKWDSSSRTNEQIEMDASKTDDANYMSVEYIPEFLLLL